MNTATPTVYIVDDDPQVCESLSLLVRSAGLNADTYPSAEAFLDRYQSAPQSPRCMVLDVRMPGISGLGLQKMLSARGEDMSIIMISGCADIPMAVQAMSGGAMDFLEKPFSRQTLLARIQTAIDHDAQRQRQSIQKSEIAARVETLSRAAARGAQSAGGRQALQADCRRVGHRREDRRQASRRRARKDAG